MSPTTTPASATAWLRAPHGSSATGVDGAPRWVSGLLAGAQAALLSLLAVAVPALAAYVATSADPSNADVGWPQSLAVGSAIWLMGHGAVLTPGGVAVSLMPLGLTGLAVFAGYASARRSAHPAVSGWWAGIGGYVAVVALVIVLAGSAGPLGAGAASVARTAVGTVVVAGVGLGAGMVRVRRLRQHTRRWWSQVHPLARHGAVAGALVVSMLVGVAAVVTCTWIISGRAATGDVVEGLGVDTFGGLLLAVAQLAVLPNFVLWVVAWLVGPGFSVGSGTLYSPDAVVAGPLPALPLLGALPTPGSEGGVLVLVPLVVVVAGVLAGWWLHRRVVSSRPWDAAVAALATAAGAGLLSGAATLLAGGSVGPGRLSVIGGHAVVVGLVTAGLTLAGAISVVVPTDASFQAAVARSWRGLRTRRAARSGQLATTPDASAPAPERPPERSEVAHEDSV